MIRLHMPIVLRPISSGPFSPTYYHASLDLLPSLFRKVMTRGPSQQTNTNIYREALGFLSRECPNDCLLFYVFFRKMIR